MGLSRVTPYATSPYTSAGMSDWEASETPWPVHGVSMSIRQCHSPGAVVDNPQEDSTLR